ncbi:cobalamin-binding protein [Neptunicella sp. SCSIO 80796]|uniref:cobalamin-binding protein n=1 Tax=Neptunicella plasticusilytica TaxID=3117012 RepID=UPI003A4E07EC
MRYLALFLLLSHVSWAKPQKIISLSPHLTELVYALNSGDKLLAISDFSDYPAEAAKLPSVASHLGVDFEAIMRLQPDLILAWRGGNKPQDLNRLESLGFSLFYSHPEKPADIAIEIMQLGKRLGQMDIAKQLSQQYSHQLEQIKQRYAAQSRLSVFYYMWPKPLMTIGQGAWANHLLDYCSADNIFADVSAAYPEVGIEAVVERQPEVIIAAQKAAPAEVQQFWQSWTPLIHKHKVKVVQVNPDLLHRFTPRLVEGLNTLCEKIR